MTHIILYQPEIYVNTGNIIRTCIAVGAKLHIIKPISFDLHPSLVKRSAAGRMLSDLEHEIHPSYESFNKKYGDKKIYYVTRYAKTIYSDANFKTNEDIFLMFGRESTGIPKEILSKNLETCLRIPMVAKERSLNLANTVMLLSYEVARQNNFENLSVVEVQKGQDYLLEDF